jgi:ATP-binding cassette, subfamily B, multidrug efflux pump
MQKRDFRDEESLGKAYDGQLIGRLVQYLRPYRVAVGLTFLTLVGSQVAMLLPPQIIRWAIDGPITRRDGTELWLVGAVFLTVLMFQFVLRTATEYLGSMTAQRVMRDLRAEVFKHLQSQSLGFYDTNPTGRLMTRVTSDVGVINDFFSTGAISIISGVMAIGLTFTFMAMLNVELSLYAAVMLPMLAGMGWFFSRGIRYTFREVRTHLARMNSYLQENLAGMAVVQIFNRERENAKQYRLFSGRYRDAQILTNFYFAVFLPGVETVGAVGIALVMWKGGLLNLDGAVSLGVLVAFFNYCERFFWPLRDISEKYNQLQQSMASAERIFSLLDTPPQIESPQKPVKVTPLQDRLRFENVSFAYNDEDWVLEDVSFDVNKGEVVAIVGATGSGKSTLINLLGRHYDIARGRITFDDIDIQRFELSDHRRRMAVVQQDVFLFSGDIATNIRLGEAGITDEEVLHAAQVVNAHEFIEKLPAQYADPLSERGSTLSVGQRQLLSFARALAFDPDILVLDEATSNVDTRTEQLIQEALSRLMSGRTSIVVAHRLSTIQHADRIVVMHHGRVREIGTHGELMRGDGIYRRLFELQYRDQFAGIEELPQTGASGA